MKDLLIALYAITAAYLSGGGIFDNRLYVALRNPTLKPFKGKIPSLEDALNATMEGRAVDYDTLGRDLGMYSKEYAMDPSSRASVTSLLKAFAAWFKNSSVGGFKVIEMNSASDIWPAWVAPAFVKTIGSQGPVSSQMRSIVKKLSGKDARGFQSVEDSAAAKVANPALYKEYLRLGREFNQIWKDAMSSFVRSSGGNKVKFKALEAYFKSHNIEHSMPTGFTGLIDATGKWYDSEGYELSPPPVANMFPTVRMNTTGQGRWVAQAIGLDGTPGKGIYRMDDIRTSRIEKFKKVRDFFPLVDKIRLKWTRLIKAYDPYKPETVAAVVLELIFQFSARVGGGAGETDGQTTYGMSTLLRKHISFGTNGFVLRYPGKAGVKTVHRFVARSLLDKEILKIVTDLCKDSKPNDPLFYYYLHNGSYRPMNAGLINRLFRALGASGITVRNLRTYHGSRIFKEEIEKIYEKRPSMKSGAEALEYVKQAAIKVGKALNHVRTKSDGSAVVTPNTALGAYIDVTLQIGFFQHYGLPLPKYLEKIGSHMNAGLITANDFKSEEKDDDKSKPKDSNDQEPDEVTVETDEETTTDNSEGDPEIDTSFLESILEKGGEAHGSFAPEDKNYNNHTSRKPRQL